jgi:RNA polymerase sigma-70 factor (ECF subfamily)
VTDLNRTGDAVRPDDVASASSAHDNGAGYHVTRKPIRNDVPNRHIPSTNGRTVGRQATPGRGVPPTATPVPAALGANSEPAGVTSPGDSALGEPAGRRRAAAAEVTQRLPIPREETVELGPVPAPAPPAQRTAPEAPFPSRPAPDDAAAEVWALVERAQGGDADAFGLIYDRYLDTVFRFIYFRVGNRPLAEDLTADTFLRALKRIGSFTWQGRDLGAWLVTIARNLVADHFKSGRYRLEVTTGDVLDADREDRGPEGSPELAVVDHITNVALLTAVRQLNPEQQECIVLRFLQGFSVAETAQAMGKNEGAIKALQYRAVRALHRLLPEGFQP